MKALLECWSRGDFRAGEAFIDADVEWHQPREAVEPGTRRGRADVADMSRGVFSIFADFRVEPLRFRDLGNGRVFVVGQMHGVSKLGGMPLEKPAAQVFTMQEGKAVRVEWFGDVDEAAAVAARYSEEE